MYWTSDLGAKIEKEGCAGVKAYYELTLSQLKDLTVLVRAKITKLEMRTISALMVMEARHTATTTILG